ncbi:ATP synthase subunit beta [Agaricicola taiwanensis]|uniref:ATP synthase subunit beta n=1 Tax=Agaricicola taiwanensis TaxID=591372 RepID=A0A8J2VXP0_9RHOB|nr:SAM-dependent methyltransferase [Agaricicola taiwanensis]GGE40128.1 ATP synthase subunit beta [Agaricicola taiwanensis]
MTPLEAKIRDLIARQGPLTVERYMEICLADPDHGYYRTRDPLGAAGDFVTAPEISQIFGELLGLWSAAVWDMMHRPAQADLVEIGPGRGTLMADATRAAKILPPFREALRVHLVETSEPLRKAQKSTLSPGGLEVCWHDSFTDLPEAPVIVLANEFFDALPIRQVGRASDGWRERVVTIARGTLAFGFGALVPDAEIPPALCGSEIGTIIELLPRARSEIQAIARHLVRHGGAALVIDYGYAGPATGDTLQAVRQHRYANVLSAPGEADLTAHVDFHQIGAAAEEAGAHAYGPISQRDLLLRLGAEARAARLKASARPDQAESVEIGFRRITAQGHRSMGDLFKAMAITAPGLPAPPAFTDQERFRP